METTSSNFAIKKALVLFNSLHALVATAAVRWQASCTCCTMTAWTSKIRNSLRIIRSLNCNERLRFTCSWPSRYMTSTASDAAAFFADSLPTANRSCPSNTSKTTRLAVRVVASSRHSLLLGHAEVMLLSPVRCTADSIIIDNIVVIIIIIIIIIIVIIIAIVIVISNNIIRIPIIRV